MAAHVTRQALPLKAGPGRPRKFGRPSRPVTVTLPDDVLGRLHAVDNDLGNAIVRVVSGNFLTARPVGGSNTSMMIEKTYNDANVRRMISGS